MKLPKDMDVPDEKHLRILAYLSLVSAIGAFISCMYFLNENQGGFVLVSAIACGLVLAGLAFCVLRWLSEGLEGIRIIKKLSAITTIVLIVLDIVHVIIGAGKRSMILSLVGYSALISGAVLILSSNVVSQSEGGLGVFTLRHELPKFSLDSQEDDQE